MDRLAVSSSHSSAQLKRLIRPASSDKLQAPKVTTAVAKKTQLNYSAIFPTRTRFKANTCPSSMQRAMISLICNVFRELNGDVDDSENVM